MKKTYRQIARETWGVESVAGMIVHHKDGDRENNTIGNLELLTRQQHGALHGTNRTKCDTHTTRFSTTMDRETLNNLREYSKTSGVPIAEVIRRSVRSYLIQKAKKEEGK